MNDIHSFSQALEIANSGRADIPKEERLAAEAYLRTLQNSADGINLSIYLLRNEKSMEISSSCFFWATNTLLCHFSESSSLIDAGKAEAMYLQLFEYIKQYILSVSQSSRSSASCATNYILGKHAQLMVGGFQHFFSCDGWNRFLLDLLEMHRQSIDQFFEGYVTMYLLRVLESIDERVVSVRDQVDRSKRQREIDMEIKDAMRESVISHFVEVWYDILSQRRSFPPPEMIKLTLELVKLYTEWIDIGLLINEKWTQLLYYYFGMPLYRVAACECFLSLVNKKQAPEVKRETLMSLRIVEEIPNMICVLWSIWNASEARPVGVSTDSHQPSSSLFHSEHSHTSETEEGEAADLEAFTDVVTALATAVGSQLLRLVEACNTAMATQQSSTSSPGSPTHPQMDMNNLSSSSLLLPHATSLLHALHTMVSVLTELIAARPLDIPMSSVIGFLQVYVKSSYFTSQEAEQLLDPLFKRTIADGICHSSFCTSESIWDENVLEDRKSIFLIISLIHRRYPDCVYAHLQEVVWCATLRAEQPHAPFFDVARIKNNKMLGVQRTFSLLPVTPGSEGNSEMAKKENSNESEFSDPALLYYFYASAPFLEAALRYVYELGSSIQLEVLRDPQAPLTQVIERLIRTASVSFFTPLLVPEDTSASRFSFSPSLSPGTPSPFLFLYGGEDYCTGSSIVHLRFFETLYRYHLFVVYHQEYLQSLMEILLLNQYGVSHPNEKTRTRICSLLRQIVFALLNVNGSSPLLPYAADMVKALSSLTPICPSDGTSAQQLNGGPYHLSLIPFTPSDRRELYETMGMLLSVAAVAAPSSSSSNARKPVGSTETGFSGVMGFPALYFQERLSTCHGYLQTIAHELLEQLGSTSVDAMKSMVCNAENGNRTPHLGWMCSQSSVSSPKSGCTSPLACSSPAPSFREDFVAECLSYCASWAKGLRLGCTNSPSVSSEQSNAAAREFFLSLLSQGNTFSPEGSDLSNNSDRISLCGIWQRCTFSTLSSMLETIGPIWHTFQLSSVVREKTGIFFSQLINVMPVYDSSLEFPFTDYLCSSLQAWRHSEQPNPDSPHLRNANHRDPNAQEGNFNDSFQRDGNTSECNSKLVTPTDLIRSLRLLHQLVGTAKKQAANTLLRVIPLLWKNLKTSVGPLRGLVSSGRECDTSADHRNFLQVSSSESAQQKTFQELLVYSAKSEQFREAVEVYKNYFLLLINAATFNCSSIFLSLPQGVFEETFAQLTDALFFPAEFDLPRSSLQFFSRILADPPSVTEKISMNVIARSTEDHSELLLLYEQLQKPIFSVFFPTCLAALTSPSFDWKDAKNALLCSEFFYFAHGASKRYGEEALQHFFSAFSPHVGEESARSLCLQLRDESRVTQGVRNLLRSILQQIQASSRLSFS